MQFSSPGAFVEGTKDEEDAARESPCTSVRARRCETERIGSRAAAPKPLFYRVGNVGSSMLRIQTPGEPEPDAKRQHVEGAVVHWHRVGVLHGRAGRLRFFLLEPDGGTNEIRIGELHITGYFKVVLATSGGLRSEQAWRAFRAGEFTERFGPVPAV